MCIVTHGPSPDSNSPPILPQPDFALPPQAFQDLTLRHLHMLVQAMRRAVADLPRHVDDAPLDLLSDLKYGFELEALRRTPQSAEDLALLIEIVIEPMNDHGGWDLGATHLRATASQILLTSDLAQKGKTHA